MMDNQIRVLFDLLQEMKESAYEHPALDFSSYRERVGRYNGLKDAIQALLDLERDDD